MASGRSLPQRSHPQGRTCFGASHMIFDQLIWIDDLSPRSAALNMAIDEPLLMQPSMTAIFRTYRWESRSVSFGYFSKCALARKQYPYLSLVLLCTHGGAVVNGWIFP